MRPSLSFLLLLAVFLGAQLAMTGAAERERAARAEAERWLRETVATFGLGDLCLATDARYLRNPALSDPLAAVMDHPGDIEHFPAGIFWVPPR